MIKPREKIIFDRSGKKKEVIISFRQYEQWKEDLHDLAIVAERKQEKEYGLDELKKRLKKDGRI